MQMVIHLILLLLISILNQCGSNRIISDLFQYQIIVLPFVIGKVAAKRKWKHYLSCRFATAEYRSVLDLCSTLWAWFSSPGCNLGERVLNYTGVNPVHGNEANAKSVLGYLWLKASRDLTETVLLGIHFWIWEFVGQPMGCSLIFWKIHIQVQLVSSAQIKRYDHISALREY